MTTIIAGKLDQQSDMERAIDNLRQAGFPSDQISAFYLSSAGQHDRFPVGGDRDKSPGAEDSTQGTAAGTTAGAIAGAAIGAATVPLVPPIGVITGSLVGAHIGNLVGSLSKMKDDGDGDGENPVPIRHAGLLVAVSAPTSPAQEQAATVLRNSGAQDIEINEGTIVQGDWQDFDPASVPRLFAN